MLFKLRGIESLEGLYVFNNWSECIEFINKTNKYSVKIFHAEMLRA